MVNYDVKHEDLGLKLYYGVEVLAAQLELASFMLSYLLQVFNYNFNLKNCENLHLVLRSLNYLQFQYLGHPFSLIINLLHQENPLAVVHQYYFEVTNHL
jgi:hypothetical protein